MVHGLFQSLSPAGLLIDNVEIGPDRIVITAPMSRRRGRMSRLRPTVPAGARPL